MIQIGSLIANGMTIAMTLFLSAAGLTLLLGILRILNFAQGTFIVIGAYVAASIIGQNSTGPVMFVLVAIAAGIALMAVGAVVERVVFRRLRHVDESSALIATFALMLFAMGMIKLIWGLDFISVSPPDGLYGAFFFGKLIVPQYSVFLWGVGIAVFIGLELFIGRMWFGKKIQSAASDPQMMALFGYNVPRLVFVAVLLACFLAGFAGGILLPNQTLQPSLADTVIIQAFAVVIIGGLGSIRGAFIASILLGLAESIGTIVMPSLAFYIGMIAILLIRPQGLFAPPGMVQTVERSFFKSLVNRGGEAARAARRQMAEASARTVPLAAAGTDLSTGSEAKHRLFLFVGVLAFATISSVPFWGGGGLMYVSAFILIDAIFAMSWNLLFGYTGLAVFGHAAFFAAGAYLVGYFLKIGSDVHFLVLLGGSALIGIVLAAPVGMIALRRSGGLQLAILTLAFAEVLRVMVSYSGQLGRDEGVTAIPRPVLPLGFTTIDLTSSLNYFWFLCVICGLCGLALWWLTHNAFGRALKCIKEDPERARFIGIHTDRYRLIAFVISGAFASLCGGLAVPLTQIVTPDAAGVFKSVAPMLATLLGGAGTFLGPFVGTVVFAVLQYSTRTMHGTSELLTGIILLLVVLAAPGGIVGSLSRLWQFVRFKTAAGGNAAASAATRGGE